MRNVRIVETDDDGCVVLPDHPDKRFLMRVNADGSILLQPATVVTEAQLVEIRTREFEDGHFAVVM